MKEDYSYLIIKYLENTLSEEDCDNFYFWINSSESNKKLFFEAKAVFDATISGHRNLDIEKSWSRLLNKRLVVRKNRVRYLSVRVASYVAVAILAVCITSIVFINREDSKNIVTRYIGGDGLEADVVILPDGTKVSLGSKTIFYYEPDYGQSQRNVFLSGEAYFEVSSNKYKPFIVNVDGMKVEALGTSFNVMAYPDDSLFVTTLLEGSVSLTMDHNNQQAILKPNQQLVYNKDTNNSKIYHVVADNYIRWTSGYYYFYEQSLESILHRINYVYGVTSEIKSEKLNNTIFTGSFYRGQSLKNIMEIINLSVPMKYKIEDRHVVIYE